GRKNTMAQAIDLVGNKATVMLFGLTAPSDEISVKPFEIFKKELTITASYINPYTQRRAIDLINANKVDVSSMVYKVASLDELPAILADGKERSKGKFIIAPWKE
ncbi:MAG: alcohol dehydrogenase, partial [Clostridia bacterium]|nr:alcohol dehydrogenase [Clostridia bacterium]